MSDQSLHIAAIILIIILALLGWKIVSVSVGPVKVELEPPETPALDRVLDSTTLECPGAPDQRVRVGDDAWVCR